MSNTQNKIIVLGSVELAEHKNVPTELTKNVRFVINVSDQPFDAISQSIKLHGVSVPYFWFPLIESCRWGYNSLGGAFMVYKELIQQGDCIIHCHAGINRSATAALLFKMAELECDALEALKHLVTYSEPIERMNTNLEHSYLPDDMLPFLIGLKTCKTLGGSYHS